MAAQAGGHCRSGRHAGAVFLTQANAGRCRPVARNLRANC
jgi:hypothetical protein